MIPSRILAACRLIVPAVALTAATAFFGPSPAQAASAYNPPYIYWAEVDDPGSIQRTYLDGTGRETIYSGEVSSGVAVDDHHVYWPVVSGVPGASSIARAGLDGSEVEEDFATIPYSDAYAVAVDSEHIYTPAGPRIRPRVGPRSRSSAPTSTADAPRT